MNIKVIDHRNFGRKPIVGIHVIKKLSRFYIDPENEIFNISRLGFNKKTFLRFLNKKFLKSVYLLANRLPIPETPEPIVSKKVNSFKLLMLF